MKKAMLVVMGMILTSLSAYAGVEDRIVGVWVNLTSIDKEKKTTEIYNFEDSTADGTYHKVGLYMLIKDLENGEKEPIYKVEFEYYFFGSTLIVEMKDKFDFKDGDFIYAGTKGNTVRTSVSLEVSEGKLYAIMDDGDTILIKL
jgi:hypothetical protein